ncbi:unnamed protein product [Diatraea saccharalis]|uniref:Uncharacterized protein n=1 Tax=Diatraea saccharalis TaxID=40085 RepID=A0A9N9WA26_9NEOP|nr:unnamed protein product [Diatraea saccharalis]
MYKQELLLLNKTPVCYTVPNARRNALLKNNNIPSHDPYISRVNTVFYNCSSTECVPISLYSITQVTSPDLKLKACYLQSDAYQCETLRFNHLKNVDKLLFLSNNIKDKLFYLVDCLVYSDRGRVCHKRDDVDSHTKLVDTGTIVRPNEPNVLSQEEFLCEEGPEGNVNCDLVPFVPYDEGLKLKESVEYKDDILLKTGDYVVTLKKNCIDSWCGFSGIVIKYKGTRRFVERGGWTYKCFYAKKQQVCMPIHDKLKHVYNERAWLSS